MSVLDQEPVHLTRRAAPGGAAPALYDELDHGVRVFGERPAGDEPTALERIPEHAELRQERDPESLGHHQLAHLGTVGRVRHLWTAFPEQPV